MFFYISDKGRVELPANLYLIINLIFKKTDRLFKRERIILLLKIGFTRKFLYKCKEDYKHYIKNIQD